MSRDLLSREICERALRLIGAFPVTESAADPENMREALFWLDLILAQMSAETRIFFLVPETVSLTLTNGVQEYNLNDVLGSQLPANGIQFPISAVLEDSNGNRTPLSIVRREVFEDVSNLADTGTPTRLYIDRLKALTLSVYPTLPSSNSTTYYVKMVVQTFAPDVSPSGVTGQQPHGGLSPNIPHSWQRWLVYALAADLGKGPVFALPKRRTDDYAAEAKQAKEELLAFDNREHQSTPPICEPYWTLD